MNDKLQLFFEAINNYDLYDEEKLIKYATKVFLDENVESNFAKFKKEIKRCELDGTSDMVDPVKSYYKN